MKFLLTGSNFFNKGAQAMLFVAVSELRSRFPGCEILFRTNEPPQPGFAFRFFHDPDGWQFAKGGYPAVKTFAKALRRMLGGRTDAFPKIFRHVREIRSVNAFVDISGYALSSQRGLERSLNYIAQIRVAKRFGIPYFVMPQSIGPFDYRDGGRMDRLLRRYLPYPVVIFPREEEGRALLQDRYGLSNVRLSMDLVLQNKGIREDLVFTAPRHLPLPEIQCGGSVAIIPNMRNFGYKSRDQMVAVYQAAIARLRRHGRRVYLLRHSSEDLEACRLVFDSLSDTSGVSVVEDDLDCIQFNATIAKFDYVIASRFHSIVHSFKNSVPAIVLGWAVKYHDLLRLFGQERFMFDVRGDWKEEALLDAIDDLDAHWQRERALIASRLPECQKDNCFDAISAYFEGKQP